MISRSEIDLLNIRREFIEKYDKSLHQAIEVRGRGWTSVGEGGRSITFLSVGLQIPPIPSLFLSSL